jgi:hypothetical protein
MKLLAVRLARAIWAIPPYFLNPRGLFMRPVFEGLKGRYSFHRTPLDVQLGPPPRDGQKFEDGAFATKEGTVLITSMTLLEFGIVVDTRSSTADADAFLEDAISWASMTYGTSSYEGLPIKRHYVSELNIRFEKVPQIINPKLSPFAELASSILGATSDIISVQFGSDPTTITKQEQFRLDRETQTPHGENRFYSMATTTTENHLKLLETLETAVS